MSPAEVVRRAKAAGMDGMAITDHQSARNAPAIAECARREGIACLYGLEVCTAEEVHALTLFDTVEQALAMTDWVYAAMVKRVNDPDVFGDQPVVTADDDIVELEWRILALACRKTIYETGEQCHALGGLYVAAHIDRSSFSCYSQLGAIPSDAHFDAVELSRTAGPQWLDKAAGHAVTRSSDAHNLDDIARVWTQAELDEFSVAGLKRAFMSNATSPSPPLTSF